MTAERTRPGHQPGVAGRARRLAARRQPDAGQHRQGIADLVAYGWCGSSSIGVSRTTAPPRWRCSSVGLLPATYTSSVGATGDPALAGTRAGSVAISRKYPGSGRCWPAAGRRWATARGGPRPGVPDQAARPRDRGVDQGDHQSGVGVGAGGLLRRGADQGQGERMVPRCEDGHGGPGEAAIRTWACSLAIDSAYHGASRSTCPAEVAASACSRAAGCSEEIPSTRLIPEDPTTAISTAIPYDRLSSADARATCPAEELGTYHAPGPPSLSVVGAKPRDGAGGHGQGTGHQPDGQNPGSGEQ